MKHVKEIVFIAIVLVCVSGGTFIGLKANLSNAVKSSMNYFTCGMLLIVLGTEFVYKLTRELPHESGNKLSTYFVIAVGLTLCSIIIVEPRDGAVKQSKVVRQMNEQALAAANPGEDPKMPKLSFADVVKLIIPKLINTFIIGTLIGTLIGRNEQSYGAIIGLAAENVLLALSNTHKLRDHMVDQKNIIYACILMILIFVSGMALGRLGITRLQQTLNDKGHVTMSVNIDAFVTVVGTTTLVWLIEEDVVPRAYKKGVDLESLWLYAGVLSGLILFWAN